MKKITAVILAVTALLPVILTGCFGKSEESVREKAVKLIPNFEERYYLSQLEDEALLNFCELYECCKNFETSCFFKYPITVSEMYRYEALIKYECPELMMYDYEAGYDYYTDLIFKDKVERRDIKYIMDKAEYEKAYEDVVKILDDLKSQTVGMSDYEKEMFYYDYIIQNCEYTEATDWAATVYGALVEKNAHCDGVSLFIKWALENEGIPSVVAAGVDDEHTRLSWNLVQIDGKYYEVNAYYDDVTEDGVQFPTPYGLFNVSSDWIRPGYKMYTENLPETGGMEKSYHALTDSYVKKGKSIEEKIDSEIDSAYKNGYNVISVQAEDEEDMLSFVEERADEFIEKWQKDNFAEFEWWEWYYYESSDVFRLEFDFKE